ncbi:MAG TPA: signal peptidase I [Solirubrobacterales bacterium]|nr:signal peptidase I [Solirubrobacterales bacterium]
MRTAAVSLAAAVCLALGAVTLVPAALGLEHYVIVSGSMAGTYDQGSVAFDDEVPVSSLRVGDVITYTPPASDPAAHATGLVTHRIYSIQRAGGQRVFRTKGDANRAPDPWTFTLDQPTQAKVVGHVPYLGYALAALSIRPVRMLAVGVPAMLIAISVLVGLIGEARTERRLEEEALLLRNSQGS